MLEVMIQAFESYNKISTKKEEVYDEHIEKLLERIISLNRRS